jgi:hypothetical protein
MSDEETVLVCVRVCDMATPHVPSYRGVYCALCGTEVWASMKAPLVTMLWCAPCAVEEAKAQGAQIGLAKETADELLAYYRRGDA